ncbi:MAG: hypothetical protein C7B46_15430 [Sulfobacillus benefaciens]|uniref:Transposase IS200-like domain-containing protein n=1 Tax=Sulfobacillus benefaciens TaxID=453960 RepID=A0A2T2XCG9_9FIRM|nr:MAG: hypothetical protein C7B46_15430 [Sulfobacillus benefaciens]
MVRRDRARPCGIGANKSLLDHDDLLKFSYKYTHSTIEPFKAFPALKQFYSRCGSLWSKGYFVSTVGNLSAETVQRYIQEQTRKENLPFPDLKVGKSGSL